MRKQKDRLEKAMPQILEGYCKMSDKPREVAEQEAKAFLQIIEDSANYQFGYNHSTGYSMIGYTCAYLRYYYPKEFITAYLNNANNEDDISMGTELANQLNIPIHSIKFRYSLSEYACDDTGIYKGIESIKFCNSKIADELYALRDNQYKSFIDLLIDITEHTSVDSRQLDILIKLDFFSEFGEPNELLTQVQIFNAIYSKKTAKKNEGMVFIGDYSMSQERFNETVIQLDEYKETAKQIKGFDSISFIKSICDLTTMPATSVEKRIQYSDELLGYVNVVDPHASKRLYYVLDVKGKKLKTIELYEVYSGKKRTVKMWESQFNRMPFEQKNFLMVRKIEKKNKRQPSNLVNQKTGKQIWVDVPNEFEFWLEGYEVDR